MRTLPTDSRQPWLLAGYELFAKEGPTGLKIEVMARRVGKSKSSFYHHFADLDVFTEWLLSYHLVRTTEIAAEERQCKNVVPELLNLLLSVKQDLLFNRQLRINRHIPAFKRCFEDASRDVGEAIVGIWSDALGLTGNSGLARMVLTQSLENFYLQLTAETLTYEWLLHYVNELQMMVNEFRNNGMRQAGVVR